MIADFCATSFSDIIISLFQTNSMAFDYEWDDNEERKIRNHPFGGEEVMLL